MSLKFKFHYVQMELIEEFFNNLDFQKFKFHYVQMEQKSIDNILNMLYEV